MANFFPLIANVYTSGSYIGNRIEELALGANLDFTGSGIVNLTVGNLHVSGGTFGQVLSTDGNGTLSWANGGSGGATHPQIEWTVSTGAASQTFTNANVAQFYDNTYAAVYVNGVLLPTSQYTIVGTTLTITPWLNATDLIAIGPTGGGGGGIGTVSNVGTLTSNAISNTAASELGFALTGGYITTTGNVTLNVPNVAQFRTNANIGNVANLNLDGNVSNILHGNGFWGPEILTAGGSNTQIQYNNAGLLAGSANYTFVDGTNPAVTLLGTMTTNNVVERGVTTSGAAVSIDLRQGAYFQQTLTAATTFTTTAASIPAAPLVGSFILHLSNCAGNPISWNFADSSGVASGLRIRWAGGTAPTLTSTTATRDILGFYTLDSGSNWYGFVLGKDVA
jgi:hypothetical protein